MDLVQAIHRSPGRAVISITGGGSGAIERLLATPGASATVLEARVPYAEAALAEWIGGKPTQACSDLTARQMAMAAFDRACALDHTGDPTELIGVGCTASLATTRPKRGDHRLHVAAQTHARTLSLTLRLEKGARTREQEEAITAHAVVATLADAARVRAIDLDKTPPGVEAMRIDQQAEPAWSELLLERRTHAAVGDVPESLGDCLLLSGSFNPLHWGHEEMARLGAEITGRPVLLELTIRNAEKPPLDFVEIDRRLVSLGDRPVLLTAAANFADKARLAPGCVFAVGVDTLVRIAAPRFYPGGIEGLRQSIDTLSELGCHFLVFGRTQEGSFLELADLPLPAELRALCDEVPESAFRVDLSSTQLRARDRVEPPSS